jgi:Mrp family chromosome partitioning ATPase
VIGEIPFEGSNTEEAFISIRSNLLHQMGTDKKTVLITSDTTGDGKTYTAINLAGALANMGKRTLLCDLDFRNPSVARELHIQEEKGLCSILTGGDIEVGEVLDLVRQSSLTDTLDVLVPGRMPAIHPANLLAHENLIKALMLLKDKYDYIVFDSSAVGQYDDVLIDGLADMTCYICRSGKTPKTAIYNLNTLDEEKRLTYPIIIVNNYRDK